MIGTIVSPAQHLQSPIESPTGEGYFGGMRVFDRPAASLLVAILWVSAAQAQSLGELARKERERKKAAPPVDKVLTNEEVAKPYFDYYPAVFSQFAMPKGWEKPVQRKNVVISPCPGASLPTGRTDPESAECALAVAVDGPSSDSKQYPAETLERIQHEFIAKVKRQIEPWRDQTLGGMKARETVVEIEKPSPTRHMRMVVAVHPQTGRYYMAALWALPGRLEEFSPALDTVLKSFEVVSQQPVRQEPR